MSKHTATTATTLTASRRGLLGSLGVGSLGVGSLALGAPAAAAALAPPETPPDGIFLAIDDIPGESKRAQHEGEIDVLAFSWGARRKAGSGRRASRSVALDLTVLAPSGIASPYLMLACADGSRVPTATVAVLRDTGEASHQVLTLVLERCVVSRYQVVTSEVDGTSLDLVAISPEKVTVRALEVRDDHSAGEEHEVVWDFSSGSA